MMYSNLFRRLLAVVACAGISVPLCGCASLGVRSGSAQLTGVLWWLTPHDLTLSEGAWNKELDYIQTLGIDTIIFNGPYAGPKGGAAFETLLERLDAREMHVYLDTLATPQWWTLDNVDDEVRRACDRAALLEQRYGRHASVAGFYIPYECYVMWNAQRDLVSSLYADVSRCCKTIAPQKKVMISPFFILDEAGYLGDFRWATPEEYQSFWQTVLTQASIDIVALQDSGEHLACYTLEQRRPFFDAMQSACDATGVTLWANVESGEVNVASLEEYVRRFGLKTPVNSPKTTPFWRAVPPEKFSAKLDFAGEYTDKAITWGYREFLRPSRDNTAAEAYLGYARLLGR
ncbi:MAG: DUF4434 domain-containing protein [Candidatus Hydrogenedentota bacterium]